MTRRPCDLWANKFYYCIALHWVIATKLSLRCLLVLWIILKSWVYFLTLLRRRSAWIYGFRETETFVFIGSGWRREDVTPCARRLSAVFSAGGRSRSWTDDEETTKSSPAHRSRQVRRVTMATSVYCAPQRGKLRRWATGMKQPFRIFPSPSLPASLRPPRRHPNRWVLGGVDGWRAGGLGGRRIRQRSPVLIVCGGPARQEASRWRRDDVGVSQTSGECDAVGLVLLPQFLVV